MHYKLDLFIAITAIAVQARVSYLVWSFAARRDAPAARTVIRTGLFLFTLLLLAGYACTSATFIATYRLPPRPVMFLGAATLGYLILAAVLVVLGAAVSRCKRIIVHSAMDPTRRRLLDAAGLAIVASPVVAIAYGALVTRTDFRVREVDVPLPGLPADLDGLRIVQISDIHLGAFLSERELARAIDQCNELRPHLAAVTGDFISSRGDPLDQCLRQVARLRADAGIYACLGNHERYAQSEEDTTAGGARLGINVLRSRHRELKFGTARLNLAGVDYQSLRNQPYLIGAERLIVPGVTNILLSHNPDVLPVAARKGFQLVLAGHTHGGQVTVEILDQSINPARFITPFVHGLYRDGAGAGYVTRGIGTIGIPARIGAPPEITLLRLRKA